MFEKSDSFGGSLLDKEDILNIFNDINSWLDKRGVSCDIVVTGDSNLILRGLMSRKTEDIDVFNELESEFLKYVEKFSMNNRCISVICLQQDFTSRVELYKDYGNLKVFLFAGIDVLVSKLLSGRAKDIDDILNSSELRKLIITKEFDKLLKDALLDNCINEGRVLSDFEYVKEVISHDNLGQEV